MTKGNPSYTALGAAVIRAAHQLTDEEPRILDDPIILRLLDSSTLDKIRIKPDRFQTARAKALRSWIVMRSRYVEDRLGEAVENGLRQYVILGAGLDTFPYRQPHWARPIRIFEVDRSASQRSKRERLRRAEIEVPSNVELIACDFEKTLLRDCLRKCGYNFEKPAFFSWLGVTAYLSMDAIDAVFRFVSSLPKSSEIVFTFKSISHSRKSSLAALTAAVGEPMITSFQPRELEDKLHEFGFSKVSFLSASEAEKLYFRNRHDGLLAPKNPGIATVKL